MKLCSAIDFCGLCLDKAYFIGSTDPLIWRCEGHFREAGLVKI